MVNPTPSRRNTLVGVGAGVVGGVALLSLVALNMHPGRPAVVVTPTVTAITPTVPAPSTIVSQPTSSASAATGTLTPTPSRTPTEAAEEGDDSTPTPSPYGSPTPSASPQESTESTNGAVVTSLKKGSYVTVYKWLSKKSTTAAEAAAYAEDQAGKGGHDPIAFDGDAVPGMNPGFWGIGVPGAQTFSESRQVCVELGFAPNGSKCWARLVK